jgi:hypothetical protein
MPVIPPVPVGPSAAELAINRLNTQAFIAANPLMLELIPRVMHRTGSGSRWEEKDPRPIQVARLIDQGPDGDTQRGDDALQRKDRFQLLLPHDGIVELYDFWVDTSGIRYEVTGLLPSNGYERRAVVTRFGQERQPIN